MSTERHPKTGDEHAEIYAAIRRDREVAIAEKEAGRAQMEQAEERIRALETTIKVMDGYRTQPTTGNER